MHVLDKSTVKKFLLTCVQDRAVDGSSEFPCCLQPFPHAAGGFGKAITDGGGHKGSDAARAHGDREATLAPGGSEYCGAKLGSINNVDGNTLLRRLGENGPVGVLACCGSNDQVKAGAVTVLVPASQPAKMPAADGLTDRILDFRRYQGKVASGGQKDLCFMRRYLAPANDQARKVICLEEYG